jgi:hypothetical protein
VNVFVPAGPPIATSLANPSANATVAPAVVAVGMADRTIELADGIDRTVAPAGMPGPETPCPTNSRLVFVSPVSVALPATMLTPVWLEVDLHAVGRELPAAERDRVATGADHVQLALPGPAGQRDAGGVAGGDLDDVVPAAGP